jgi:hypothetical protein
MKCHSVIGCTGLAVAAATSSSKRVANLLALGAASLSLWGTSALAFTNLVKNPSFEVNGGGGQFQGTGFFAAFGPSTSVTDWTVTGLGQSIAVIRDNNNLSIWPALTSATLPVTTSGTFYFQADGDITGPYNASISQVINNLTPGNTYELSFDWAAGSQYPYRPITSGWDIIFGTDTDSVSAIVPNPNTFSGWKPYAKTFIANSTGSQILRFLSKGTPAGEPPMSLLDNVQLREMPPVPGPLGILGAAAAFGYSRRIRRRIRRY